MNYDDDIMRAIGQTAADAMNNQRTMDIEQFIQMVASVQTDSIRTGLPTYASNAVPEPTKSEMILWCMNNRERFAQRVGQVIILLLRQELLGE